MGLRTGWEGFKEENEELAKKFKRNVLHGYNATELIQVYGEIMIKLGWIKTTQLE